VAQHPYSPTWPLLSGLGLTVVADHRINRQWGVKLAQLTDGRPYRPPFDAADL